MEISAGTTIDDRYSVQHTIGQGGFATVYLALDQRLSDRPTALKVLNAHGNSAQHARFQREIRALARIIHPNVVTIFDYGTFEGHAYYIMENLGGSLRDVLCSVEHGEDTLDGDPLIRPLVWPLVRSILLQVAYGVQAIHQSDILHRDLKPENVLLHDLKQEPLVVKIADFGVAKLLNTNITHTADPRIGTILYMPPELLATLHLRKDPEVLRSIDPTIGSRTTSDIYAIGIMAYEMLTGEVPFYTKGGPVVPLISHRLQADIPHLAEFVPEEIPPDTATVLSRCVARNYLDRPANIDELIAVLSDDDSTSSLCDITQEVEQHHPHIDISSDGTAVLDILYLETTQIPIHPDPVCSFNIWRVNDLLCFEVDMHAIILEGERQERKLTLGTDPSSQGSFQIRWRRPRVRHKYHYSCGATHAGGSARYFNVRTHGLHRFSLFLGPGAFAVLLTSPTLPRPVLLIAPARTQ